MPLVMEAEIKNSSTLVLIILKPGEVHEVFGRVAGICGARVTLVMTLMINHLIVSV